MKRPIIVLRHRRGGPAPERTTALRGGGASEAAQGATLVRVAGPGEAGAAPAARAPPMTVELAAVTRADMSQQMMVVGNLIGLATVETTPKVERPPRERVGPVGRSGSRGQQVAKIEDSELLEQIKQAEASFAVAAATIRQREADLGAARGRTSNDRAICTNAIDSEANLRRRRGAESGGAGEVELAKAQYPQAQARLDELKIDLVEHRHHLRRSTASSASGRSTRAHGSPPNSVFLSVVDISSVLHRRERGQRDLRRITMGLHGPGRSGCVPGREVHRARGQYRPRSSIRPRARRRSRSKSRTRTSG